MTIAERLKALRKERNLSQERLADVMGISSRDLVRIHEHGDVRPNLETAQRYADAFGLRLDELFEGVEVR